MAYAHKTKAQNKITAIQVNPYGGKKEKGE